MTFNNDRIKILHVIGNLGLGGTEKTMQLFAAKIDRRRFLPFAYSFADGVRRPMLERDGVKVFVGGDLFALLGKIKPHIIHVHRAGWTERKKMRPIALYKNANALPVVIETNVFGRFDGSTDDAVIDAHLFVSRFCLERYLRCNGLERNDAKYSFLYNPIEVGEFQAAGAKRMWDASRPVIGRASRDDPGKWAPVGWEILPLAAARHPNVKYRIIGTIAAAEAYFTENALLDRVEMLPQTSDMDALAAFYGSLNVFLHANATGESFGNVIAEAMASGLPVATLRSRGLNDNAQAELVEHGETGFVADTLEEYATYVNALLGDFELARRMGRRGQEKAKREFDVGVVVRKLEMIYEKKLEDALARRRG